MEVNKPKPSKSSALGYRLLWLLVFPVINRVLHVSYMDALAIVSLCLVIVAVAFWLIRKLYSSPVQQEGE